MTRRKQQRNNAHDADLTPPTGSGTGGAAPAGRPVCVDDPVAAPADAGPPGKEPPPGGCASGRRPTEAELLELVSTRTNPEICGILGCSMRTLFRWRKDLGLANARPGWSQSRRDAHAKRCRDLHEARLAGHPIRDNRTTADLHARPCDESAWAAALGGMRFDNVRTTPTVAARYDHAPPALHGKASS